MDNLRITMHCAGCGIAAHSYTPIQALDGMVYEIPLCPGCWGRYAAIQGAVQEAMRERQEAEALLTPEESSP